MTYAMNRLIQQLSRMPAWIQNLITFADMQELLQYVGDPDFPNIIEDFARERRESK